MVNTFYIKYFISNGEIAHDTKLAYDHIQIINCTCLEEEKDFPFSFTKTLSSSLYYFNILYGSDSGNRVVINKIIPSKPSKFND